VDELCLCVGVSEGKEVISMHKLKGHEGGSPDEVPAAFSACELSIHFGSSCFMAISMVLIRLSSCTDTCAYLSSS
jgi:hypothetical protein